MNMWFQLTIQNIINFLRRMSRVVYPLQRRIQYTAKHLRVSIFAKTSILVVLQAFEYASVDHYLLVKETVSKQP